MQNFGSLLINWFETIVQIVVIASVVINERKDYLNLKYQLAYWFIKKSICLSSNSNSLTSS